VTPFNVTGFSCSANIDVVEATDMEDTNKTYLTAFKDWTASVSTLAENAAFTSILASIGVSATLTLTCISGVILTGTAICKSVAFKQDKDGIPTVDWDFQGNGTLSGS
jgi:hypothetical protein